MLKIEKKNFLRLPVRLDDQSETWFNTFCVLIRSQTLVSAKDKVTCLIDYNNNNNNDRLTAFDPGQPG